VLSSDCKNETEYLEKAVKLTRQIMLAEDWKLDDMFYGKIPTDKRNYDFKY